MNKLLKTGIVTKTKVQNQLTWALANTDDVSKAVNDDNISTQHDDISTRKNNETQTNQDLESSSTPTIDSVYELLKSININNKEEILFLRNEIKQKNDIIASQQKIISMLVIDHERDEISRNNLQVPEKGFKPYTKTFRHGKNNPPENISCTNQYECFL